MKKKFVPLVCISLLFVVAGVSRASLRVMDLRCEYRINPLGIDVEQPRLSWVLQSDQRGAAQSAYQILVASDREKLDQEVGDVWDSGKVNSNQTIHVTCQGVALRTNRDYFWKVRVWDKANVSSGWSEAAFWSTGLLAPSDWQAKCWIGRSATTIPRPKAGLFQRECCGGNFQYRKRSSEPSLLSAASACSSCTSTVKKLATRCWRRR